MKIDVKRLDLDFLACSGHKMCGPTGIGCLYGKQDRLEEFGTLIAGGETINDMDLRTYSLDELPYRLEAGIQNYAGAIGLGAAVDYLTKTGMDGIERHEKDLAKELVEGLLSIPSVSLIGPKDASLKTALASFTVRGMAPHDMAMMLDREGIAIRSGMQCAYPFHKFIGEPRGSARASLYFYNTKEEIRTFIEKLGNITRILA